MRIHYKDTLPIRSDVLRSGRPESDCIFDGDDHEQTFHLGAFIENKLVSIASFFYDKNSKIDNENQYRLRGMATIEEYRGKGLSSELLEMAFSIIKQNFCDKLWCNARVESVGFYEKVGFSKFDDQVFLIKDVGEHSLMSRNI